MSRNKKPNPEPKNPTQNEDAGDDEEEAAAHYDSPEDADEWQEYQYPSEIWAESEEDYEWDYQERDDNYAQSEEA